MLKKVIKRKILNLNRKNRHIKYRGQIIIINRFLSETTKSEDNRMTSLKLIGEKFVNLAYYSHWEYLSWNGGKYFSDKLKLREFTSRPLQEILSRILQTEGEWYLREILSFTKEWRALEMLNIWVNITIPFFLIYKFKNNWLFKTKIIAVYCGIHNK